MISASPSLFDSVAMAAIYGFLIYGILAVAFRCWQRFIERCFEDRDKPPDSP